MASNRDSNQTKSEEILKKLFDEFIQTVRKKRGTKQWGELTLQTFIKDGEIDRIRICDDTSFKPSSL